MKMRAEYFKIQNINHQSYLNMNIYSFYYREIGVELTKYCKLDFDKYLNGLSFNYE